MAKADLHVHSRYSEHHSEWLLQRLGAGESYTDPDTIYNLAKSRRMDFVTITDHNRIDGVQILMEKYPNEVFMGVEATAYFPEDGCKVHILIYDFTPEQFDEIQRLRTNIYQLRDFIVANHLPYSVAHATYSVNGRLKIEHIEKLILLFDVFEVVNGGRNRLNNETCLDVMKHLTPSILCQLSERYQIQPIGPRSWTKGFTGGSDDHAGIFIANSFTGSNAVTKADFLKDLREKRTFGQGRHNNYQSLAFQVYKIATDFLKEKSGKSTNLYFNQLADYMVHHQPTGFRENLKRKKLKYIGRNAGKIQKPLVELLEKLHNSEPSSPDERFEIIYEQIAKLVDAYIMDFISLSENSLKNKDIIGFFQNIFSFIPGLFITAPFLTSLKHMYNTRNIITGLQRKYLPETRRNSKRILWFTDTINDLNGVAVTLKKLGWVASETNRSMMIATTLPWQPQNDELPPNILNLPYIHEFTMPYYDKYKLKVPSILKALELIDRYQPDEIIISTPGPVGLMGLLVAKYLNVKCSGIYHTDFTMQANEIVNNESISQIIEQAMRWFYSAMDEVYVPTNEYIALLEQRGIERHKMRLFKRGIDTKLFAPDPAARTTMMKRYNIPEGTFLLFAGRISQDKNLDFLLDIQNRLLVHHPDTQLIIAGDGPYMRTFREKASIVKNVHLLGEIKYHDLPVLYAGSDLFVFPSNTDTFGMVVLEAQACGLPAIVSNQGGPKEVIRDHATGLIIPTNQPDLWVQTIRDLIEKIKIGDKYIFYLKTEARQRTLACNWESVLADIFGEAPITPVKELPESIIRVKASGITHQQATLTV